MIYFDCLELLGLTQNCEFWGSVVNFRNVQDYTVRGRISGDRNGDLIAPAWSGMGDLMTYTSGYLPLYAQGVLLGTGKITQLQFEATTDVLYKPFTASFQVLKSGDLSQLTGATYTGLATGFGFFPYLNSFTEDYQYAQTDNLTTEFTRNLNFNLEKGYIDQVSGAHILSSRILATLADLGIYSPPVPPQFYGNEGVVRSLSHTLDTINGSFGYSETFNYQSGRSYNHDYNHSLEYGENGVTTVSEQGSVQSTRRVSGTGARIEFAVSGWNQVLTGIFDRVSGVFNRWQSEFQNSGCPLMVDPIETSISKDFSRGILSYDYLYSNDSSYSGGFYHSYERSLERNEQGWIQVGVNGEIRSRQKDPSGQLDSITSFYQTGVRPYVTGYAQTSYAEWSNFFKSPYCSGSGGFPSGLALLNSQETYTDRPANLQYDYNFTNDPSYISTGVFRKIKNTVSDQGITPLVNYFKIPNYLELPQDSFQSNLGTLSNSVEIIGSSGVSIQQYKAAASGRLVIPSGEHWMLDNSYNFSPLSYRFTMNVSYAYTGHRQINNFAI